MNTNILALDVGEKRVGLAMVVGVPRIPRELPTLERTADNFWVHLGEIMSAHKIEKIVVGLPRGLDGQETAQTRAVQAFVEELKLRVHVPTLWQDEAGTSVMAEEALQASGKPYTKADIDAKAAQLILSDYLEVETHT